jgi:O-antigen/teichoic acid export membrane protein
MLRATLQLARLMAIRGGGLLLLFGANILIARSYGIAVLGQLQFGIALATIASTIGRLGQDQLMLVNAARNLASGQAKQTIEMLVAAIQLVMVPLGVATLVLLGFLKLGEVSSGANLNIELAMPVVVATLPMALTMIGTEALRGAQKIEAGITLQSLLPQFFFFAAVSALSFWEIRQIVWIGVGYVFGFILSAALTVYLWSVSIKTMVRQPNMGAIVANFQQGLPFWLSASLNVAIAWVDVLILGVWATSNELGQYTAVVRTGSIIGTFIMLATAPIAPRLAVMYAQKDGKSFSRLYAQYSVMFFALSLPVAAVVFGWPQRIMSVWHSGQQDLTSTFRIYAAFQLLQFYTALPTQIVLVLGLERKVAAANALSLIVKVLLICVGYAVFGMTGAVIGAGISLLFYNFTNMFLFSKRVRILGVRAIPISACIGELSRLKLSMTGK